MIKIHVWHLDMQIGKSLYFLMLISLVVKQMHLRVFRNNTNPCNVLFALALIPVCLAKMLTEVQVRAVPLCPCLLSITYAGARQAW